MTAMKRQLEDLAATLAAYEKAPFDAETACAVDCSNHELDGLNRGAEANPAIQPLVSVVLLALEEDGARFIPAARVLCAAVLGGF